MSTNQVSIHNETYKSLFDQGNGRYVLFPIQLPQVWAAYKQQVQCFWTVEEIDLATDVVHWRNLNESEREFIKTVLAFFAASDGIVGENIIENFSTMFEAPEVRCFYNCQSFMEGIHSEMYSLLIDTLIDDNQEKMNLFNAINTVDCVKEKALWAEKWMQNDAPLGNKLVAFAAVEGIFFSTSFCAIFWLKKRGLMPGLCTSNEFISRDEGMHTKFACLLIGMLKECHMRPDDVTITSIIKEAVSVEENFVNQALNVNLIGINATLMIQYLHCVADNLLYDLEVEQIYNTKNPFEWMDMISIEGKTNFFEKRVSEYQRPPANTGFLIATDF